LASRIKKQKGIWEQLLELKAVTAETGTVHEAQVLQLKLWGFLALPHVQASEMSLAVGLPHMDGEEARELYRVEYRVKSDARPPRNLKKLLNGLARSVKKLLGDYFTVAVLVNGKTIFLSKGERKVKTTFKQIAARMKKYEQPTSESK
jgi:hypothetical protein